MTPIVWWVTEATSAVTRSPLRNPVNAGVDVWLRALRAADFVASLPADAYATNEVSSSLQSWAACVPDFEPKIDAIVCDRSWAFACNELVAAAASAVAPLEPASVVMLSRYACSCSSVSSCTRAFAPSAVASPGYLSGNFHTVASAMDPPMAIDLAYAARMSE